MILRFLGHSAFYLEGEALKILIDPFLTGNPLCPVKPEEFFTLTHILVTHAHNDHVGDTVMLAKRTGATIVCEAGLADYFEEQGLSVLSMNIGGRVGPFHMVTAVHGSTLQSNPTRDGGIACGFVVTIDGVKIYHAGDTALTMDMLLLKEEHIDIALLPVGGRYTMDWSDALKAVRFIEPSFFVPMHYNTSIHIGLDKKNMVAPRDIRTKILAPGETLEYRTK
ncbi:metal-dependent hydrolase [Guggenheimella bovis]